MATEASSPRGGASARTVPNLPRAAEVSTGVMVVGGGMSGICTSIQLHKRGIPFIVAERSPKPGGTWFENRYPNCACDIPYLQYTFSFEPHVVSELYAPSATIEAYMLRCVDKYNVKQFFRCNTTVMSATFDEEAKRWLTVLRGPDPLNPGQQATTVVRSRFLVSATGQLNVPKTPVFQGQDTLGVPSWHTARWDPNGQVDGKKVAIIGNGASAVQCVEGLYKRVKQLYIFQRSPKWILKRPIEQFPWLLLVIALRVPFMLWVMRCFVFLYQEVFHMILASNGCCARRCNRRLAAKMNRRLGTAARGLIPSTPAGCTRVIIESCYTTALQAPNVEVVSVGGPTKRMRLNRTGVEVETAGGYGQAAVRRFKVDCVVYATGFRMNNCIPGFPIIGRGGRRLVDAWKRSPDAYLGLFACDFPNAFFLYGPNTNTIAGSISFFTECGVNLLCKAVSLTMRRGPKATIEVKPAVVQAYNRRLDTIMATRPEAGDCSSWYKNKEGRVTQNFPGTMTFYWWLTRTLRESDYNVVE